MNDCLDDEEIMTISHRHLEYFAPHLKSLDDEKISFFDLNK